MDNIQTASSIREATYILTAATTAFFSVIITAWAFLRREAKHKQKLAVERKAIETLRIELLRKDELARRRAIGERVEEAALSVQYARRLNEIIQSEHIRERDKEEYETIHNLIVLRNEGLVRKARETDFVLEHEFSSLVTALNSFCNIYEHERNIFLRVNLLNADSRFSPAYQISFFRMLFEMVFLTVNKTRSADATIEIQQLESTIHFKYLDTGICAYPKEFQDAIAVCGMVDPKRVLIHNRGVSVDLLLSADVFSEQ